MSKLEAIRARALAFEEHGTPGLAAPADRKLLLGALDAVLGLHRKMPCLDEDGDPLGFYYCEACEDLDDGEPVHESYPCMTVREITKAFAGEESFAQMRDRIEEMCK